MEWNNFLEELNRYMEASDILSVSRDVSDLKKRFEDFVLEQERLEQVAMLNAAEANTTYEPKDIRSLKEPIVKRFQEFRECRLALEKTKQDEEKENTRRKNQLISRLQDIIHNEEKIGVALNAYKEIHDEWKQIGQVARENRDQIQKEYSKLIEQFFYNLKIYRELKDHDLKRNAQLKQEVIQELVALKNISSVKDVELRLRALQNDWEGIGPVQNEEWEGLKSAYWDQVRAIYDRINHHYELRRASLHENIEKKKEILEKVEDLLSTIPKLDSAKQWESYTQALLSLQEEWKSIGFGPKKENDQIWKQFRTMCDSFFDQKKSFFGTIQGQYDQIAEKKKMLIDKAKSLKDSTDWKATSEKLIQLQKEWKKAGHAGNKFEQKLWNEFRSICDFFFHAREAQQAVISETFAQNLVLKNELIKEIEQAILPTEKADALSMLKGFSDKFNTLGQVPSSEKDNLHRAFKAAMDKHYGALKLEGEEKERVLFQAKLDTIASSPDAVKLYARERSELKNQMERLRHDVIQYENNLGFFARSKGAESLRHEVENKIRQANDRIEVLRRKIKLIPNE